MGHESRNSPFTSWGGAGEAAAKTQTCDRYGRVVQSGDVVHLIAKQDIMWKVVHVKPILDAKAPPGLVEIALVASFVTGVPGGMPVADMIKVRDASEFAPPPEVEDPRMTDPIPIVRP